MKTFLGKILMGSCFVPVEVVCDSYGSYAKGCNYSPEDAVSVIFLLRDTCICEPSTSWALR